MTKAALFASGLAPVLMFSLSGCFLVGGGSGTPSGDPSDGSGGGLEGGATACIIDKNWQLDIDDAATKLGEELRAKGQNVTSATGVGEQGLFFDQEGIAGSATDLVYTVVVDMGDGIVMTMTQQHEGDPGGNWAWDGESDSTILFDGWEGDYVITTTISLNGSASDPSVTHGEGLGGQSMTVSCDGDTMQTQAAGSPFVQIWHAVD